MKVELDAPLSDIGIPKIVTNPDIFAWRPAGSSWEPETVMCDAGLQIPSVRLVLRKVRQLSGADDGRLPPAFPGRAFLWRLTTPPP